MKAFALLFGFASVASGFRIKMELANLYDQELGKVVKDASAEVMLNINETWSAACAERVRMLVVDKAWDGTRIHRAIPNYIVQFGIPTASKEIADKYRPRPLLPEDKHPEASNVRGTISMAQADNESRNFQVFINFADNSFLDERGFLPIGKVDSGMDVFEKRVWAGEGDKVDQHLLESIGEIYARKTHPRLAKISRAYLVDDEGAEVVFSEQDMKAFYAEQYASFKKLIEDRKQYKAEKAARAEAEAAAAKGEERVEEEL
ncbi:putative peptidyl-prolyl cis-trans isomerase [Diplonema papillatum]|nr:putative peptidyl-prolyl cis-trans isomerase [Diplonema papillatum]